MLSLGDDDVLMMGGGGGGIGEVYKMTRVVNMARGMWQQTHKERPTLSHATHISTAFCFHFAFPRREMTVYNDGKRGNVYNVPRKHNAVGLIRLKITLHRIYPNHCIWHRSQWLRGLRRRSAAARLLRLWVRIPPGGHGYLSVVSVVCCQVEVSATS